MSEYVLSQCLSSACREVLRPRPDSSSGRRACEQIDISCSTEHPLPPEVMLSVQQCRFTFTFTTLTPSGSPIVEKGLSFVVELGVIAFRVL